MFVYQKYADYTHMLHNYISLKICRRVATNCIFIFTFTAHDVAKLLDCFEEQLII